MARPMSEEASHEAGTREAVEAAATAPQRLVLPACTPLPRWYACCCPRGAVMTNVEQRRTGNVLVDPEPCRKLPCSVIVGRIRSARGTGPHHRVAPNVGHMPGYMFVRSALAPSEHPGAAMCAARLDAAVCRRARIGPEAGQSGYEEEKGRER